MDEMMASQGGGGHQLRDYRKGNWTVEETMILIEAKKMDDERRMKSERGKPIEQRWKWIEDYCWRKGCFRSQSQCNDKWDNLMRDFKKVREYERRLAAAAADQKGENIESFSYWKMEKNQRKDKNLPSNMLSQIYEALVEVVERRGGAGGGGSSSQRVMSVGGGGGGGGVERPAFFVGQPQVLPPIMQHSTQNPTPLIPRPPPQTTLPQPTTSNLPYSQPLPTLDSDTSEHSDSPAKRRRREGGGGGGGGGEGTSGGGGSGGGGGGGGGNASGSSNSQEVVSAICKSATIMAEAIQAREDREERRHRELLSLHERGLQIEESKAESTRQGINGMVDAINKLADSILALASSNTNNNQVTPR